MFFVFLRLIWVPIVFSFDSSKCSSSCTSLAPLHNNMHQNSTMRCKIWRLGSSKLFEFFFLLNISDWHVYPSVYLNRWGIIRDCDAALMSTIVFCCVFSRRHAKANLLLFFKISKLSLRLTLKLFPVAFFLLQFGLPLLNITTNKKPAIM